MAIKGIWIVFYFGRVPRCARVGLLRTTLTLGATLRFALPDGMLRIPHASSLWMFYLICTYTLVLPYLILIIKHLQ
ncbi:MAG: hypothetical protein RML94_00795 [Bacteroidia bacterium]|nr:hypothetical protein [Bacteroidia bacterium]